MARFKFAQFLFLGFAAAQVHSQAQAPDTAWLPLFDGRGMGHWDYAKDFWRSDSGMLIGQGKASVSTFCHTGRAYSDFVFSGWTRLWETSAGYANSGIQYRSQMVDSLAHRMQGYQWDIGGGFDGSILPENGFPSDAPPREISEACRAVIKRNAWNHVVITADRGSIRHELNGVVCLEYQASVASGYLGLQFPATNTVMKVDFRDLYIRPLYASFAIADSEAVFLNAEYSTHASVSLYPIAPRSQAPFAIAGFPAFGEARRDLRGRIVTIPLNASAKAASR